MQAGMCTDSEVNREALDSTTSRRPHLYGSHFEIKDLLFQRSRFSWW